MLHKVKLNQSDNSVEKVRLSTAIMSTENEVVLTEDHEDIQFLRRVLERMENMDDDEVLVIRKVSR